MYVSFYVDNVKSKNFVNRDPLKPALSNGHLCINIADKYMRRRFKTLGKFRLQPGSFFYSRIKVERYAGDRNLSAKRVHVHYTVQKQ